MWIVKSINQICRLVSEYAQFEHFFHINDQIKVCFPNLEHLELVFKHLDRYVTNNFENILHSNPQLQSLKIQSDYVLSLTWVLDVIRTNSLITKLQVNNNVSGVTAFVDKSELNRFVAEHPTIAELIIPSYLLIGIDAVDLIRQMKSLYSKLRATLYAIV